MPEQGDRSFFNDFQVADKGLVVDNADTTLSVHQQVVTVATDSAETDITLPGVAEAVGKMYSVHAPNGTTNSCIVQDANDSIGWADQTIAVNDGFVLVYSDGRIWHVLNSDLTA